MVHRTFAKNSRAHCTKLPCQKPRKSGIQKIFAEIREFISANKREFLRESENLFAEIRLRFSANKFKKSRNFDERAFSLPFTSMPICGKRRTVCLGGVSGKSWGLRNVAQARFFFNKPQFVLSQTAVCKLLFDIVQIVVSD